MTHSSSSPNPRHIALFGFYRYGNFGDDLMAVIFGRELKSRNIPFRVYQLRPGRLEEFGFQGAASLDELLDNAAAVVYGGGGAFLASKVEEHNLAIQRLCGECAKRNIPIYLFSVGGAGAAYEQIPKARQTLLEQAAFITFRAREDEAHLNRIGRTKGAIHQDIVWRTPVYFRLRKKPGGRFIVGIDSTLWNEKRSRRFLQLLITLCRLSGRNYRFVTFVQDRHHRIEADPIDSVYYGESLRGFIGEVLQTDVILTGRLHLGMTAMAYDIPVLQLFPGPKAAQLFAALGLNHLMFSSRSSRLKLLRLFTDKKNFPKLLPSKQIANLPGVIHDSANHCRVLFDVLERTFSTPPLCPAAAPAVSPALSETTASSPAHKSGRKNKTVILYQTHFINDFVLEGYSRLRDACAETCDVVFFYDTTYDGYQHRGKIPGNHFLFDRSILWSLPYSPFNEEDRNFRRPLSRAFLESFGFKTTGELPYKVIPGNRDLALLHYFEKNPGYAHYWVIEYDVRYTGDWRYFFDAFGTSDADFLAARLRKYAKCPEGKWWHTLKAPPLTPRFSKKDLVFAFLPVLRISREALLYLKKNYMKGWSGHQEVLVPSLLYRGGFKLEDLGGTGEFVRPNNWKRFYQSENFFAGENSEGFSYIEESPQLFHPVKNSEMLRPSSPCPT